MRSGIKEKVTAPFGVFGQGRARQPFVVGAIEGLPFTDDECAKCIADFDDGDISGFFNVVKGLDEHVPIGRDRAHPFGDDGPCHINPVMGGPCDFVFAGVSGHFKLRHQWEKCLGGNEIVEPCGQPFFGGGIVAVAVDIRNCQSPVVEQRVDVIMSKIPKAWRVAGDAFADRVGACSGRAVWANADTAFANPQREAIAACVIVVMAGAARDILVA